MPSPRVEGRSGSGSVGTVEYRSWHKWMAASLPERWTRNRLAGTLWHMRAPQGESNPPPSTPKCPHPPVCCSSVCGTLRAHCAHCDASDRNSGSACAVHQWSGMGWSRCSVRRQGRQVLSPRGLLLYSTVRMGHSIHCTAGCTCGKAEASMRRTEVAHVSTPSTSVQAVPAERPRRDTDLQSVRQPNAA